MNIKYFFNFLLLIIFFIACDQETTTPLQREQFFDLKAYFEKEQVRLKQVKQVIKKATVDGKLEEKTMERIDFEQELALFVDSDINKISWIDKYIADTTKQDNNIILINYLAKDEKLKTNSLSVHYKSNKVDKINIIRKTSSIAAELEQILTYYPNSGYSIKSFQKTSLSDPHVLELDVQFVQ